MKSFSVLSVIATVATLVAADGTIDVFTEGNCAGTASPGTYSPPSSCGGGCVFGASWASAESVSTDSGYISLGLETESEANVCYSGCLVTVYTDSSCSDGATAVRGCVTGNWNSFSYDCGS
ncbi:hypothetical protein F5B20DRAFT_583597 [Whalleya microplaca]|nr:hypothetical protein F5B20DRAFT_583597 [Whalleya microplaca]